MNGTMLNDQCSITLSMFFDTEIDQECGMDSNPQQCPSFG